ncbi:MAG: hypothetical protein JRN15_13020 [Nitrososphaerota archaeon]|nr:hypothetical protein [Nitrososphaerota archaeon]
MRTSAILSAIGVAAIALVLGIALGSVAFPMFETTTQVLTIQPTPQESTTLYFGVPTVTIPVPCCANIPESFAVGNYVFDVSQYAPLPPVTRNGTVTAFSAGVLLMFNVMPLNNNGTKFFDQVANFTWAGTFSETVPHPSKATLYGGDVRLNWFVNSLMLYLQVSTGSSSFANSTTSWPVTTVVYNSTA